MRLELPVLSSRSLLVTYFLYSTVYMCLVFCVLGVFFAVLQLVESSPWPRLEPKPSTVRVKWSEMIVAQSCLTHWDPMDCSLPFPSPVSSQPRDWTWVFRIAGRFFTIWATREAPQWEWGVLTIGLPRDSLKCTLLFWGGWGGWHHEACGILVPWPGIELMPPALEGKILTTGLPGKSPVVYIC